MASKEPGEIFKGGDCSIEVYLENKGFSTEFIDLFIRPFYGGITLDRSLSESSKVFEFTYKMMSQGKVCVPKYGMAEIPLQLKKKARENDVSIEINQEAKSIKGDGEVVEIDFRQSVENFDSVIVATDQKEANRLTGVDSVPRDSKSCVTQYYEVEDIAD